VIETAPAPAATAPPRAQPPSPAPPATPADRAAVYGALGWGAVLVWQLALSRVVLRSAGAEAWGLWATIAAFKSFVLFVDGGLAQGIARDAGREFAEGAPARLRIRAAWRLDAVAAAAALLVAAVLAPWAAGYLGLRGNVAAIAPALVLVHGVDAALSLLAGPLPALVRGRRWFGVLALGNLAQALLGIALLCWLAPAHGALGAAAAVVATRAAVAVCTWRWLRRQDMAVRSVHGDGASTAAARRAMFAAVVPIWAMIAATQLAMRADVPIVGWFFGAVAAGHYELGQQLPFAAMSLLGAVMAFALPRFVRDHAAGDEQALHRQLPRVVFMACLLAGLGFSVLAMMASDVLTLWVGIAPPQAVATARLYAAAWACNAAVHVLVQVAIAHGRFALLLRQSIAASLANFALSVVLAACGRVDGPAWATFATMAVCDLVIVPILLVRSLRLPGSAVARGALSGWLLGGVLALGVTTASTGLANGALSRVLLACLLVFAVAGVVLDLTVLRRSSLRAFCQRWH
jgi:O-antigen/teichoic acid export membrane protein